MRVRKRAVCLLTFVTPGTELGTMSGIDWTVPAHKAEAAFRGQRQSNVLSSTTTQLPMEQLRWAISNFEARDENTDALMLKSSFEQIRIPSSSQQCFFLDLQALIDCYCLTCSPAPALVCIAGHRRIGNIVH